VIVMMDLVSYVLVSAGAVCTVVLEALRVLCLAVPEAASIPNKVMMLYIYIYCVADDGQLVHSSQVIRFISQKKKI